MKEIIRVYDETCSQKKYQSSRLCHTLDNLADLGKLTGRGRLCYFLMSRLVAYWLPLERRLHSEELTSGRSAEIMRHYEQLHAATCPKIMLSTFKTKRATLDEQVLSRVMATLDKVVRGQLELEDEGHRWTKEDLLRSDKLKLDDPLTADIYTEAFRAEIGKAVNVLMKENRTEYERKSACGLLRYLLMNPCRHFVGHFSDVFSIEANILEKFPEHFEPVGGSDEELSEFYHFWTLSQACSRANHIYGLFGNPNILQPTDYRYIGVHKGWPI